jgi:hypothetical protein
MSNFEILMGALSLITAIACVVRWTISYTDEKVKEALASIQASLNSINQNQSLQWSRLDLLKEKLLVLETKAVTENDVRRLNEEHRVQVKADSNEVKAILAAVTDSVETIKVSIAVAEAVAKRQGH